MNEIFVVFDYTLSIENIEKLYFTLVEIVCIVFFFFFLRKFKHFVPEDFFLINVKRLTIKRKKNLFISIENGYF